MIHKIIKWLRNRFSPKKELLRKPTHIKKDIIDTSIKYEVLSNYYPLIIKSKVYFELELIKKEPTTKKGLLEDYFFDYLKQSFPFNIERNYTLNIDNKKITPDFIYLNQEDNVFIIIEIDEPYTSSNEGILTPIHYQKKDIARNNLVVLNGCHLIRFAESQIALTPQRCIEAVKGFINGDNEIQVPTIIPQWNYEEALEMIKNKARNQYLPIPFKGVSNKISIYSYRSFKIKSIRFGYNDEHLDKYIIHIDNSNNLTNANIPKEIWINEHDFQSIIQSSSKLFKIISKYDFLNDADGLRMAVRDSFLKGFQIEGNGKKNQHYFNFQNIKDVKIKSTNLQLQKFDNYWIQFELELNKKLEEEEEGEKNKPRLILH